MIKAHIEQRLRGFSLDVDFESSGPVLGIFGRSGSGKTTLLHALAGLSKPSRCAVEVAGEELSRRPGGVWVPPERRGLAIVPQDPLLFPHLTTRGNLTFAPGAQEQLESSRGQKVLDCLRLRPLLERDPATLSGGERQRVALGRAWLSKPRLLLLDEPVSALDAELGREVLALLLEAKRELGVPMLFVTHQVSELIALADDCLVLDEGRVVAQGAPLDVLARPRAVGIAKLVGVDNLLRLSVLRHDEDGGVTMLDLGEGQALASPLCALPQGAAIDIGVQAEDILLCTSAPSATSARNVLHGRITATDAIGHEVLISMLVGCETLRVRVTPGAVRELGLIEGQEVFALIKTTACHHLSG
jgi:molybdate transport system ATP-binding protein